MTVTIDGEVWKSAELRQARAVAAAVGDWEVVAALRELLELLED
jgi:hypothetical protein